MATISRREFVKATAAGVAMTGLATAKAEAAKGPLGFPIGSQTWPHRKELKENPAALLKQFADLGIERIELCSPIGYNDFNTLPKPAELKRMMGDNNIKCESAHFSMKELRETQQQSLDWAKEIGITQIITATLGRSRTPTMDDVKQAADEYNKIAAITAKAGLQQGLHNEGFEVSSVDGKRTYDLLLELLDPKLVKFQFQMSTIRDGFVGAEYFEKYPGRFFSIHLQDWDPDTKTIVAIGKGKIDWKKTFEAGKKAGVKNYFVEQNMELTKDGVAFLKTLKV